MQSLKRGRVLTIFLGLLSLTCSDNDVKVADRAYPSINTASVTAVDESGATFNGNILSLGTSTVVDYGFVYDDIPKPIVEMSDVVSLGETPTKGPFSAFVNRNLVKDRTYHVRAFAMTVDKVVYGEMVDFVSQGGGAPEVTQILPAQGVVGDTIVITGAGFSNAKDDNHVAFNGVPVRVLRASGDTLRCVVAEQTAVGENTVSVEVGQMVANAPTKFSLLPILIKSFSPSTPTFGDTLVIEGENFSLVKGLIVPSMLGRKPPIVDFSRNQLSVIIDKDITESVSLLTITIGTQTAAAGDSLRLAKPLIASFSPQRGTRNTEVVIEGDFFSIVKANNKVEINGKMLSVLESSSKTLKVGIPSGITPGFFPLVVTTAKQKVLSTSTFEIIKPAITAVIPTHGMWDDIVAISGESFSPLASENIVKFNDFVATVISSSVNEVKVRVPATLSVETSTISIKVISVDGLIALSETPFSLDLPQITAFEPSHGIWEDIVTISGENFSTTPSNNIVKFNDIDGLVISSTAIEIKARVPVTLASKTSTLSVGRIYVDGLTAIADAPFICDLPEISGFTPTEGKTNSVITITGSNFSLVPGENNVYFGTVQAEVISASENQLIVRLPTLLIGGEVEVKAGKGPYFATAQGSFHLLAPWRKIADFPGNAKLSAVGFTFGNYGYVVLGTETGQTNEKPMWRYSPASNQWAQAAPCRTESAFHYVDQVAFTIGDTAYVSFGMTAVSIFESVRNTTVMKYSPNEGIWRTAAHPQSAARWGPIGFKINGNGYVASGGSPETWQYDPITTTWVRKMDVPGAWPRQWASGFSVGSSGYLVGGECTAFCGLSKEVLRYDPDTDQWTRLGDFPGAARVSASTFTINGDAYLLGGNPGNDFWKYTPLTDTWTQLPDFPGAKRSQAVVFVIGGKAYYGTGAGQGYYYKDFWEFDPSML